MATPRPGAGVPLGRPVCHAQTTPPRRPSRQRKRWCAQSGRLAGGVLAALSRVALSRLALSAALAAAAAVSPPGARRTESSFVMLSTAALISRSDAPHAAITAALVATAITELNHGRPRLTDMRLLRVWVGTGKRARGRPAGAGAGD